MKPTLLLFLSIFSISLWAAPGDTVRVQTHQDVLIRTNPAVGNTRYTAWGVFPNVDVRKIRMYLSFECPPGESCGEWDYLNYITLRRAGGVAGDTLNVELARYITPYGLGYSSSWKGEWYMDVSDFSGLLRDSVEVEYMHTGYETSVGRGWIINLRFECIEGTPARPFLAMHKLWNGNYSYGNAANPINDQLGTRSVDLSADARSIRSYIVQTGHSFGDIENCAEFCPKTRTLKMDGSTYSEELVWRDNCGENPNFPQAGTWLYDRSAWCPGDLAYPSVKDLSVEGGTSHTFTMEMQDYINQGGSSPNYVVESFLFEYGQNTFSQDVSVEEIMAPSTDYYYSRFNPICGKPRIRIRNNGRSNLQSCVIRYGDVNGPKSYYTWTGNLASMESADIDLPPTVIWGAEGQFEAIAEQPNNQTDEYSLNNRVLSTYESPMSLPDSFIVNVRSNNIGAESSWEIRDVNDQVVASRYQFADNTEYKDTVRLGHGCYSFILYDSDKDGLSWWANNDGDGFVRIRKANGSGFWKLWGADFGSSIKETFTVGGTLGLEPATTQGAMSLYPNPSAEGSTLNVALKQAAPLQVRVFSAEGRMLLSQELPVNDVHLVALQKPAASGLYLVEVQSGSYRETRRWVVQ